MAETTEFLGYNATGNKIVRLSLNNGHSMTYGLTLCCEASDKGWEDGVVCRKCFRYLSVTEQGDLYDVEIVRPAKEGLWQR